MDIYKEKGTFKPAVLEMFSSFAKLPEMSEIIKHEKKFIQFGINKVFMKEEVKDVLEYKLNRIKYIQRIQNNYRRWTIQRKIMKQLWSIKIIQCHIKGLRYRR